MCSLIKYFARSTIVVYQGRLGMPRELENLLPSTKQMTSMQKWVDKIEQLGGEVS